MHSCAICGKKFESESPAVLYMSKYGNPRSLCEDCEGLLDRATDENDPIARREAREALAELSHSMKDAEAMAVLRDVLDGIFSAEQTEQDIEDERAFEASVDKEERETPTKTTVWDVIIPCAMGAAAIAFIVFMIFFR